MQPLRLIVIGNGVAGITAARTVRALRQDAEITVISDESPYFYARTALMWVYMRQLSRAALEPFERRLWREERLELVHDRVVALDVARRTVTLESGATRSYDRLLLATGAEPARFGWPGQELSGVQHFCTLSDLAALEALRPRVERAVVVGGGLIGIELVELLLHDRVAVTYLIREPWYWDLVLSRDEAELVHTLLREHGVELLLEDLPEELLGDDRGQVRELVTRAGRRLPCQLVGLATGVRPRIALAQAAGLPCGQGILVDRTLRTSVPEVYAAGDCAEIALEPDGRTLVQKLWYTAQRQGEAVGRVLAGLDAPYDPGVPYGSAQFLFCDYLTVGWFPHAPYPPAAELLGRATAPRTVAELALREHVVRSPRTRASARIAYLENQQVLGFSLLGARWNAALLMRWIRERRPLPWVLEHLEEARFDEEFRRPPFPEGTSRA